MLFAINSKKGDISIELTMGTFLNSLDNDMKIQLTSTASNSTISWFFHTVLRGNSPGLKARTSPTWSLIFGTNEPGRKNWNTKTATRVAERRIAHSWG